MNNVKLLKLFLNIICLMELIILISFILNLKYQEWSLILLANQILHSNYYPNLNIIKLIEKMEKNEDKCMLPYSFSFTY